MRWALDVLVRGAWIPSSLFNALPSCEAGLRHQGPRSYGFGGRVQNAKGLGAKTRRWAGRFSGSKAIHSDLYLLT